MNGMDRGFSIRREAILLAAFLLFVLPLDAYSAKGRGSASRVVISGTVTFEKQPVAGADIYLLTSNPASGALVASSVAEKVTRSGKDGAFRFTHAAAKADGNPVVFYLTALHPQYALGWAGLPSLADTSGVVISLSKPNPLAGRVIDRGGKPIPGAQVWISHMFIRSSAAPGRVGNAISFGNPSPGAFATADAGGRFTLAHAPADINAGLMVKAPGHALQFRWGVSSGNDTMTVTLLPEGRIAGKVTFPGSGKPVPKVRVHAYAPQGSPGSSSPGMGEAVTDRTGRFLVSNLMPGNYLLSPIPEGEYSDWVVKPKEGVKVEEGKTTSGADFELSRGGIVTGRITEKDSGAPVSGQTVYLQQTNRTQPGFNSRKTTGENGEFRIRTIPGDVTISVYPSGGYTSETPYLTRGVTVAEGDTVRGVDFQFMKGIEVRGTTRTQDGKPVAGVQVSASTADRSMGGPLAVSDAQGRFTITGFKAGEKVTLKAAQAGERLRSKVDLEVKPGTEIDIMMKPYTTTAVEGRVFKPDGNPAPGVEIQLVRWDKDSGTGTGMAAAVSDREGKFRIPDLEVGNDFSLSAQHNQAQIGTFTLAETTKPFELRLPKADRWLAGRVTDKSGAPLAGVRVTVNGGPSGYMDSMTDDKGQYRLEGLVSLVEEISISANALGWFRYKYVLTNRNRDFALAVGNRFLSGVVRDTSGKPVPGASLSVSGEEPGTSQIFANADTEGKFRLDKLSNPRETVRVSTRDGRGKLFTDIETNRDGVVFTLDPAPQPKPSLTAAAVPAPASAPAPPRIAAPYPVKVSAGKAAVVIDGDLAEWAGLGAKAEPVRFADPDNLPRFIRSRSPEADDLSLTFQCCADRDFVYFAVKVTDDTLCFGYNYFGNSSWEDGIEIRFFGEGKPDYTGQIVVSAEKDGTLRLEGRDPVTGEKYPYLPQAAGVRAALKKRAGGYDVEAAAPWSFLRRSGWAAGRLTGMNIMAYDRDQEKLSDYGIDGMVEWAANPGENYGLLKFDSFPSPEGQYSPENADAVNAILQNIKSKEWDKAEAALAAAGGGPWVKPLLAVVRQKAGKRDQCLRDFIETARTASNPSVAWWAVDAAYMELRIHEQRGKEDDSGIGYQDLLSLPLSENQRTNISLALGRACLLTGKFEESRRIVEKVMQTPGFASRDPQTVSDARQLLEAARLALEEKK